MCSACIVGQPVCIGNINIEQVAMDTQQYILFSIIVELNIFCYNKIYLHLKLKCPMCVSSFYKIWSFMADFYKSFQYQIS